MGVMLLLLMMKMLLDRLPMMLAMMVAVVVPVMMMSLLLLLMTFAVAMSHQSCFIPCQLPFPELSHDAAELAAKCRWLSLG